LELSAQAKAGEPHQGRQGGEVIRQGKQRTTVRLSDRKIRVRKPRLRRKGKGRGGEVEVPALEAINANGGVGSRILEILLCNVSTRNYHKVIPKMAETVGVSRSAVSREFVRQSGQELKKLAERDFSDCEFLIFYLDGVQFGEHHVICAIGVDSEGHKHVLGIQQGASENAASATALLEHLVERGIDSNRNYLFVIDASKALRAAIGRVLGDESPVQRCRLHKERNVKAKLPEELADQVKAEMRAAYRLPYQEGIRRLKKRAEWLELEHPGAAASLREGLTEMFTINRLELSPSLRLCLGSTNIIESPFSGVRARTNRVSRWRNGKMVLRWTATALLETENNFRRIQGYRDLWMLKAKLEDNVEVDAQEEVA
ncbi:MAG: transposase, partial [Acidobacteriota bacterium]